MEPPTSPMEPPTPPTDTGTTTTTTQEYRLSGDEVLAQIKRLVHEGNVRRVSIKDAKGHTIVHFPLTVGVVGAALVPVWAAIGAIVALIADCTIEVERTA